MERREVREPKSSDWVPARHGGKTVRAATRIAPGCNIVEYRRLRGDAIKERVEEAHDWSALTDEIIIEQSNNARENGGRYFRSRPKTEFTLQDK